MTLLGSTLVLATEAEAERDGIDVILPAAAELFYGAVGFVLLYVVLSRFAFPRLNEVLEERRQSIQGRLEEADSRLAEADEVKSQYEAQLADARNEANRVIEEAKTTAESLRRDMVNKAEAEAQAIVQRAQSEAEAERDRALQQLRSEVGSMSVELASRIVEKELDESSHRDLVDHYIEQLSGSN